MTTYTKYFGVITDEMIDMGVDESPFQDDKGNEFEYAVEYLPEGDGNGMIRIKDSIGRMVPIDCANLGELVIVLREAHTSSIAERLNNEAMIRSGW